MVKLKYRDDRPVLYVSGPLSALTGWGWEQNVRRAEEIGYELKKLGAAPFVPHTDDRFFHAHHDRIQAMEIDISLLSRCDGIVLIPDWEKSEGAKDEANYATFHGIPSICVSPLPWGHEEWFRLQSWILGLSKRMVSNGA